MSGLLQDKRGAGRSIEELRAIAYELRCDVVDMVHAAGSGHPGGSLSAAEIITALYWHAMKIRPSDPSWPGRDRFVLSKGHAAPILYAALSRLGYFPREELLRLRHNGSILQGHPDMRKTPGLDMTTGSLGQGLSIALGMALGARYAASPYSVFVLLSDGELQEGMIWEAAMAASHYAVGNLTAIVDYNGLQVDGRVSDIMAIEPLAAKWEAFGWASRCVQGHDVQALCNIFDSLQRDRVVGRPIAILCETVKGKGVSFMENVVEWHAKPITDEERSLALRELRDALEACDHERIRSTQ